MEGYGITTLLPPDTRFIVTKSKFHDEALEKEAILREIAKCNPNIDMCDQGHKFIKLPDHPLKDGKARCPYCMATGIDARDKEV